MTEQDRDALLARIATLQVERDAAREEAGVEKHLRKYQREEMMGYLQRLTLARDALVTTGYFTAEQVKGLEIAPRIIEMHVAHQQVILDAARKLREDGVGHLVATDLEDSLRWTRDPQTCGHPWWNCREDGGTVCRTCGADTSSLEPMGG